MTRPTKAIFPALASLMLTLMLFCLAPGAFAFSAVGDPSDPSGADLAAAITAAYNAGAAGVTINPGTYTLSQPNTNSPAEDPNLNLSQFSRPFEIDGYGVTLVMSGDHAGLDCNYDAGLVIKGLTFTRGTPYGNQGVILALGTDSGGAYCDVQNDAGYPTDTANYYYSTVLVGNSHVPRSAVPDLFGGAVTDLGNNQVKVYFKNVGSWSATTAQVGDYLVCCAGDQSMLRVIGCNDCTLQDTTFLSSACECAIEEYEGTGNHYLHDTITYGPPPPGATAAPMRTISSGLQAQDDYVGPDVENCYFEGTGDDGYDLHGEYVTVTNVNVSANTITVNYAPNSDFWLWYAATPSDPEPIRLSNGAGEYLDTTVLQQQVSADKTSDVLTLTAAPPADFVQAGAVASNPSQNCPGYKLINDTVRDSRGHGIQARGDNGLIQGCTFANLQYHGVLIGVAPGPFTESDYSHNVTIQDNVFNNTPGLIIDGVGARGNANITVTGNVFANTIGGFYNYDDVPGTSDCPGLAALGVAGLTVSNNTFADLGQQTSIGGPHPNSMHAVNIQNCSQVTLADNLLTNPGPNIASPVYAVDAVSQQSITGMDAASFADPITPGEYVTLTNVAAGLNLDDPGYSTQAGTLLQLWPADGASAQNWLVNWQADGSCTLTDQAAGDLVLDGTAYGGAGTYQQLWYVDGATAQEWWFIPSAPSGYVLQNVSAGLNLDDPDYSTQPGTHLQLWPADGASAQNWLVNPAPAPTLTSLSPSSVVAGSGAFTLTLTGTGFTSATAVAFGSDTTLTPTAVSGTQMTLAVPAPDVAAAGPVTVTVTTPGCGTASAAFTVVAPNPAPAVTSLSPASAVAGSGALTLTVTGSGFLPTSALSFGGTALTVTGRTATQLVATVPAADIATAGTPAVAVTTPAPGGGSATAAFTVKAPTPQEVYRINAGGGAASPYAADGGFSGGSTYSTAAAISTAGVTSPAPQAVYQTERYGNFTYTLPKLTAGAAYTLRLHFAEIYWSAAGSRLFNVSVNGTQVLTSFDVFKAAGGKDKALVETFPVTANSAGQVVVTFTTVKDNAKVSGVELTH